jgi:hypothetical protein
LAGANTIVRFQDAFNIVRTTAKVEAYSPVEGESKAAETIGQ